MFLFLPSQVDAELYKYIYIKLQRLLCRNEKQSDLAEQIESVAYELCGDTKITSDKFHQIFQEKGVSWSSTNLYCATYIEESTRYPKHEVVFILKLKFGRESALSLL